MRDFNIGIWLSKVTISVGAWLGVSESLILILVQFGKITEDQGDASRGLIVAIGVLIASFTSSEDMKGLKEKDFLEGDIEE